MKKMNRLFVTILLALAISALTCCTYKYNALPTVAYTAIGGLNTVVNDSLVIDTNVTSAKFTISVKAEAGIAQLTYSKDTTKTTVTSAINKTEYSSDTIFNVGAGKNYYFTTTVADNDQNEVYQKLTIIAKSKINKYAVELKSSTDTANTSSYNTFENEAYRASQAKINAAKVDFIYYSSDTATVEFFAPSSDLCSALGSKYFVNDTYFTPKNATLIQAITMTATDFDNISDNDVILNATGITSHEVTKLKTGKVFAFQTVNGKKGLAKVAEIIPGLKGSISLIIKIQK